jgi:DNA-binding transcriptional MocR family regulator
MLQITQLNLPAGLIDFGVGQPEVALLPLDLLKKSAEHRFNQSDPSPLQYGTEQGNGYFRRALARFLSPGYGMSVDPDQLFITAGATYGLDLICTYFAKAGDTIFVEEPTYFLALHIFSDRRLNVVGIPIDDKGMIIEALEEKLAKHQPAFVYTIPTFHNPAAVTLTASRREKLVRLSEKHNFLIVADEVYQLLAYTATPPAPMISFDQAGTVLSLGSFSKILAPGLRLGWIQAGDEFLRRLAGSGLLLSGGGLNPFTASVVQSALELSLQDKHLTHLKKIYRQRSAALVAALHEHLPASVSFVEPEGGFFVWLQFPEDVDTASLRRKARQQDIDFQPGVNFSINRGLQNFMRLCFVYYDSDVLRNGVQRLAKVLSGEIL